MEIKFRYTDNDYIELSKFYNEETGVAERGRKVNAILTPGVLLLALIIIMDFFGDFIIIPFLCWIIFTLIWVMFNEKIYNFKVVRSFKSALKNEKSRGIDFQKDTTITLNDEGIKKEIEGIETNIKWEAVEKMYIVKKNIFIKLKNVTYINIPTRVLKNNNEKEELLKIINKHIKSDFGLIN